MSQRILRSTVGLNASETPRQTAQNHKRTSKITEDATGRGDIHKIPKQKLRTAEVSTVPSKRPRCKTPERAKPTSSDLPQSMDHACYYPLSSNAASSLLRPARPHRTNAPLITPRGSRLTTYTQRQSNISPTEMGNPGPTAATTGHLLEQACAHLIKVEPRLHSLIDKHYCHVFSPKALAEEVNPFKNLCSGIMAQQVSGAAASSIKKKFIRLFHCQPDKNEIAEPETFPTPAQVAASSISFLRQAGLSERKAEYIKGLAEKFTRGELSADTLVNASDEEVLERLTAIRGLGKWSVEMFACFGLKRMDIFSTSDLGVQ